MAYTTTDLTNVEAAIIALQTGNRVAQAMDGSKLIKYSESSLRDLVALRATIQMELGLIRPRTYAQQGGRGD